MRARLAGALVGLAALDADPAVLDHVDAAPAVRSRRCRSAAAMTLERRLSSSPSTLTGTPCSKPITTSRGSVAVGFVSSHTPGGGHGPRVLHLAALDGPAPEVVVDGVHLLLRRHDRDVVVVRRSRCSPRGSSPSCAPGAMTSRSGARARVDTSKRTWSLPLPVQPWATASAPWYRAASTRCFTMTGRDSADTSG